LVAAAAFGAAVIGAIVAVMMLRADSPGPLADAGPMSGSPPLGEVADARPEILELVLVGVPRYAALRTLVATLPGALVVSYRAEESVVTLAGADAVKLAELLQGRALDTPTPLVLEVMEVSIGKEPGAGPRVLFQAVAPEAASVLADAGPGALDAGPIEAIVAPGGLSP
jgi:hypothetical protein